MGACASIHKSPRVVIVGIGSKAKRIFTVSPTKEKPLNGKNSVGEFSFEEKKHVEKNHLGLKSPEFVAGSKDEIFFDSRAWLDSDCEDDFFSVNGDFTPSRDPSTEPSPTSRKKLAELFREAKQVEKPLNEQNASEANTYKLDSVEFLKPLDSNPYSFEFRTPSECLKNKQEKASSMLQCCLPISPQCISIDERSAKMSSRQCAA